MSVHIGDTSAASDISPGDPAASAGTQPRRVQVDPTVQPGMPGLTSRGGAPGIASVRPEPGPFDLADRRFSQFSQTSLHEPPGAAADEFEMAQQRLKQRQQGLQRQHLANQETDLSLKEQELHNQKSQQRLTSLKMMLELERANQDLQREAIGRLCDGIRAAGKRLNS